MKHRYLTGYLIGTFLFFGQSLAGTPALDDALRAAGWKVTHEADGGLLLRRQDSPVTASGPSAPKATAVDRWAPLRARGWRVVESADGTVSLYPPAAVQETTSTVGDEGGHSRPAGSVAKKGTGPSSSGIAFDTDALIDAMRSTGWKARRTADGGVVFRRRAATAPPAASSRWAALRAKGWRVVEAADGSVSLYPPGAAKEVAESVRTAGGGGASGASSCPGTVVDAGVVPPVDTWAKAHRVAVAWIDRRGERGVIVGRIRHVLRVYLISIVEKRRPHRLRHQIVVRRRDGRVFLVD